MNKEDTGEITTFAPEADSAVECEFNTHELKTWMGRFHISLVHSTGREGYDPYNSAPVRAPVK